MFPKKKNHQYGDGYKPHAAPKALKVMNTRGEASPGMDQYVETRVVRLRSIELAGFQGEDLEDEHRLFDQLEQSIGENKRLKQYLVILPGVRPYAAVELSQLGAASEGMTLFTVPGGEYVIFKFDKKDIGRFWCEVCTEENQANYNIDLSKPRYEVFIPEEQPVEHLEWYIPTKG